MNKLKNLIISVLLILIPLIVSSDTLEVKDLDDNFGLKKIKIKGSIDSLSISGGVISYDFFIDSGYSIIDSLYLTCIIDTLFIYGRIDTISDTTGYTLINKDHSYYQKYGKIAIDIIKFCNSIGVEVDSLNPEIRRLTAKLVLNKKKYKDVDRVSLSEDQLECLGKKFLEDLRERIGTLPINIFDRAFEKALGSIN